MADPSPEGGVQLSPLLVASPGTGGQPPQNRVAEGARHLFHEFMALPLIVRLAILGGIVALGFIGYSRWRAAAGSSTPLGFWNSDTGGTVGSNAPSPAAANTDPTQAAAPAAPAPVPSLPPLPSANFSSFTPSAPTATPNQGPQFVAAALQGLSLARQGTPQARQPVSAPPAPAVQSAPVQSIAQQLFAGAAQGAQPILVRAGGGGGRYQ